MSKLIEFPAAVGGGRPDDRLRLDGEGAAGRKGEDTPDPAAEPRGGRGAQPVLHPRHGGKCRRGRPAQQGVGIIAFTPPDDAAAFDDLLPPGFHLLPQRGADLGERLLHAAEDLLVRGLCLRKPDQRR